MDLIKSLTDRFFRYVAIPSQSDAAVKTVPTSKGQTELANLLADELKDLGVSSVSVDEHSCVYGTLKGNCKGPVVGFLAHLDTVNVSLSPIIHPQIIHYDGGDVDIDIEKLNELEKENFDNNFESIISFEVKDTPKSKDEKDNLALSTSTSASSDENPLMKFNSLKTKIEELEKEVKTYSESQNLIQHNETLDEYFERIKKLKETLNFITKSKNNQ